MLTAMTIYRLNGWTTIKFIATLFTIYLYYVDLPYTNYTLTNAPVS
jgi:hypothetical protein